MTTTHVVGLSSFFFFSKGPGSSGSQRNIRNLLSGWLQKLEFSPPVFKGHLVFPINDNNSHWSTGWVDLASKRICVLNSCNRLPTPTNVLSAIKSTLVDIFSCDFNVVQIKSPQQTNLSDCGVYVAYHIYLISCYSNFLQFKCNQVVASLSKSCGIDEADLGIPKINPTTMRRYLTASIFMKRSNPLYLDHQEGFFASDSSGWSACFHESDLGDLALPIPGTTKPLLSEELMHSVFPVADSEVFILSENFSLFIPITYYFVHSILVSRSQLLELFIFTKHDVRQEMKSETVPTDGITVPSFPSLPSKSSQVPVSSSLEYRWKNQLVFVLLFKHWSGLLC